MAKYPVEEWQVAQLRLTAFSVPQSTSRREEWWEEMAGVAPNQSITDRKQNVTLVSGDYENATLTLGLASHRTDWTLSAAEGIIEPGTAFPEIGPLPEVSGAFSSLAERWLSREDLPEITRLAFGAVLHHPEADHGSAYNRLRDYIPVTIDPTWRDLNFQVNVHREVQSAEHSIRYFNRLSRWLVLRMSAGRLAFGDGGILTTSAATPSFMLRLELDMNTPAENVDPIPRAQFVPLYRELVADASAIARDGVTNEQYRIG